MKLSRRSWMAGCAGAVTGVLTSGTGVTRAADKWGKPVLWQMETEALIDALPVRNPAVRIRSKADPKILILPGAGRGHSERALNAVGWLIWNTCDGKHTVTQITEGITRHFDIREEQAYTDCLAFLLHMKLFNAILV